MHIENECFEEALEREARKFLELDAGGRRARRGPRRIIVADFEYRWDRSRYEGYRVAEGESAEPKIRWPFHRIAAASWMQLRFNSGEDVPIVESVIILTEEEVSEQEMVTQFFGALRQVPNAQLVTWGGEVKDLAVLRRSAGEFGLVLPPQLLDRSPHAKERIDLCRAVTVQAKEPHLPEYAAATSIPAKPSPSKQIGQLVEKCDWPKVREQVLADVMTTSVIALRHLTSHGEITIDAEASAIAIGEAALSAVSESKFLRDSYRPWARDRQRAAVLRGVVYRAE